MRGKLSSMMLKLVKMGEASLVIVGGGRICMHPFKKKKEIVKEVRQVKTVKVKVIHV